MQLIGSRLFLCKVLFFTLLLEPALFLLLTPSFPLSTFVTSASAQNRISPVFMSSQDNTAEFSDMRFGKFVIPSNHIFYRSRLSAAFVNLRPIVPGHVLVVSKRVVSRLEDLNEEEYGDLWQAVRTVQRALTKHYDATAFNVAVQDGYHAGQTVPHVHVHLLPRVEGDIEPNDQVYDEIEEWAPRKEMGDTKSKLNVPNDKDRKDRTIDEMAEEASLYRKIMSSL